MSTQVPLPNPNTVEKVPTSLRAKITVLCIVAFAVIGIVELLVSTLRGNTPADSSSVAEARKLLNVILDGSSVLTGAVWARNETLSPS